jgi:coenzyme F420 biosynthesis associated uncharacterized protein
MLSGGGPALSPSEATEAVAELRGAAARSESFVAETARISARSGPPVLVVDRAGWARANTTGMRRLLAPALEKAAERLGTRPSAVVSSVGRRVTGAELGSLLAFLASRVLGQYDPFRQDAGRLLLVAPNIVAAERELDVPASDFRLWVCLHEETHRVQFGATPWLAENMSWRIGDLASSVFGERDLAERLRGAVGGLADLIRGGDQGDSAQRGATSLLDLVQTPAQREAMADLTAVMSLLEGHADVVMDAVGPDVVPSVEVIRERFTRRRAGRGGLDRLLRRLLGLEAKMRQYADGARFVREVQDRVGVDGFNAVWTSPDTLPKATEIAEPDAWVRRVHG